MKNSYVLDEETITSVQNTLKAEFWRDIYPNYTQEQKIQYWVNCYYLMMRDDYATDEEEQFRDVFGRRMLEINKMLDKDFEDFLPEIIGKLGYSKEKVFKVMYNNEENNT